MMAQAANAAPLTFPGIDIARKQLPLPNRIPLS
jgi:hypothetical protein